MKSGDVVEKLPEEIKTDEELKRMREAGKEIVETFTCIPVFMLEQLSTDQLLNTIYHSLRVIDWRKLITKEDRNTLFLLMREIVVILETHEAFGNLEEG